MQGFHHKRAIGTSKVALSVLATVLLALAAFVSLRAAWGMYDKLLAATDEEQVTKAQLAELQSQESRMSKAAAALGTQRGVEAEVRNRYGVAKPGEGEIQVVQSAAGTSSQPVPPQSLAQRLWHALFVW